MLSDAASEGLGRGLKPGDHHYRAFVGPPQNYDLVAAMQFNVLTLLGLREHHYLLDIGCGSLRAGRLFIPYLLSGRYYGIEPEAWLLQEGIDKELGADLVRLKEPVFSNDTNFTLTDFGRQFNFLLAQSIFSHASQKQIIRCLEQAQQVMDTSAIFAATFVQGAGNYDGDDWVYPDCAIYTLERISELASANNLSCNPLSWKHPSGQTWVVFEREA